MKKKILFLLIVLALAIGFALPMAIPASAADIGLEKGVSPASPNIYRLGDTIHYVMNVVNLNDVDSMRIDLVEDILPDGTVVPLTVPAVPYILPPGGNQPYTLDWVVTVAGVGLVTNTLHVVGVQLSTLEDPFNATVTKSSLIVTPSIDIEKYVSVDGGMTWQDADSPTGPTAIVGNNVQFKVVVTNTGGADLTNVSVSDTDFTFTGVATSLAIGASDTSDILTVPAVAGQHNNVATVTAQAQGVPVTDNDPAHYIGVAPCIDVQKTVDCNDDGVFLDTDYGTAGDTGHWRIVVTNCGDTTLYNVMTTDTNGQSFGPTDLAPGAWVQYDYDTIVNETTTNVATAVGYDVAGGTWTDTDDATNVIVGMEGCTPGYWKNNADKWGAVAWGPTGYSPSQTLESVFDVPNSLGLDNYTLLQALSFKGGNGVQGAAQILLRAAVAALLNAAHPDISYAMSEQAVIDAVNAALASGDRATMLMLYEDLDWYNNAGCSLDMHGYPINDFVNDG